jgi:hypothetical protein
MATRSVHHSKSRHLFLVSVELDSLLSSLQDWDELNLFELNAIKSAPFTPIQLN